MFPRCPDGHRWWECAHPELANRPLGIAVMSTGGALAVVGLLELLIR